MGAGNELPYLKQIADTLKQLVSASKGSDRGNDSIKVLEKATVKQTIESSKGYTQVGTNLEAVTKTIHDALYIEMQEGDKIIDKSIFQILREELVSMMQSAFKVSIIESGTTREKGVAEVLNDIKTEQVTMNNRLDAIASAIDTTNTRLNTIARNTGDTVSALATANGKLAEIDSNTENISLSVKDGVESALNSSSRLRGIETDADQLFNIKNDVSTIKDKVTSIDNKTPSPNP